MTETPAPPHQSDDTTPLQGEGADADADAGGDGAMTGVLAQVRERGYITTGEIIAAFPDLEPDTDQLRNRWAMLE